MTSEDFRIEQKAGQWRIVALGAAARDHARGDRRFENGVARIDPPDVARLFGDLAARGFSVDLPQGLPAQGWSSHLLALAIGSLLILLPLLVYLLL